MPRRRSLADGVSDRFRELWSQRRPCILVTPRRDGTPHAVPVGVTLDLTERVARVICSGGSQKAVNVAAAGRAGARVSLTLVEGRTWSTLEGVAVVDDDPGAVRDAEHRYAREYKEPRENPQRVVLRVAVDRVLGNA
ncbi:TIGR03618 family F420-dependent PPOX class oxidoreductase [Pseudonocardia sp. HH130630-07]|uniref:TIGR03618 family F420-dependent PPOX class oxidoreductase n=1 Tax=Pseudonocardia sp. HH130630-07 TaxID=1690815 RepID=UPI00081530EF|nr:TIGR03618 family F420-dependent PPOX class oxidoreductase [Pseudonocardia sp. HH130630-07]ANY07956.1 acyltransferase [Pseudonocardia sp. HH130630-07]